MISEVSQRFDDPCNDPYQLPIHGSLLKILHNRDTGRMLRRVVITVLCFNILANLKLAQFSLPFLTLRLLELYSHGVIATAL